MELVQDFVTDSRATPQTIELARCLLTGTFADRAACDELLTRHARRWELHRLALVDRNILRLAIHELRTHRAPPKVVITEAIRLAKEFSTAESPRFINGVLDAILRELQGASARAASEGPCEESPSQAP